MQITFTPIRSDGTLSVSVAGDAITIDGDTADFGFLSDGDSIPASAVNSPWIVGREVKKDGGKVHVTVCLPYVAGSPEDTVVAATDGTVTLPEWGTS